MFHWFRRKKVSEYNVWQGYVSRFRGRLQGLAHEMSVSLGKEVSCFYSPSNGGVLSVGGSHVARVSVFGDECGFPVTAFISTSLEGESLEKLKRIFAGHVNTVIDPLRR
jgi:hypothetical protein